MFKYRGKGINIVFGEPLPPKTAPPPRPAPKNIAAEALKVRDFLAQDPKRSYLHASRNFNVTRARISQLMKIVKTLPTDFIEQIGHSDDYALIKHFSGVNLLKIAKMDTLDDRQEHITQMHINIKS